MQRYGLLWATGAAVVLAGCASIPADRGFSDVRRQTADRGLTIPDDAEAERAHLTSETLAKPLTEADAVRVAFLNNPRIQGVYARLGLSGADVIDAGRLRNPTLDGAALFPSAAGDVTRYDLGLTQSLVELLLLPARLRFTQGEFERTKLEATQSLLTLAGEVQTAYYEAVGARQIAAMRKTIAAAARASADLQARFKAAGNATALQLAVEMAAGSQAQLDADQADAEVKAAENRLNERMGLPPDAEWEVTDALPMPVKTEDRLDDLQALAAARRADLDSDRRAVMLLEDSLGVTRSYRFLGDVQVGVQYERDTDRNRLLGPSLSLQLPIFNQGQAPILRAQSHLDAARADLKAKELKVGNDVQAAYDRLIATRKRVDRLGNETIPLREAIVARTQEQVNYMLVGVFDALRVRQEEYAAYQQYLEAIRDYWAARVELSQAVGSRLPSDDQVGRAVIAPEYPVQPKDGGMGHMGHSMGSMAMPGMDHSKPGMESMSGMDRGNGRASGSGKSGGAMQDMPGMAGTKAGADDVKSKKPSAKGKPGKTAAPLPASPAPLPHDHDAAPDSGPAPKPDSPTSEHPHGDTP